MKYPDAAGQSKSRLSFSAIFGTIVLSGMTVAVLFTAVALPGLFG